MHDATSRRGIPLPFEIRSRIRALIDERGERQVIDLLGLSRQTLARCVGGLGVYRGTHALVRERLEALT
jgi:hypothetical protein